MQHDFTSTADAVAADQTEAQAVAQFDPVLPITLALGMSLSEIATARQVLDQIERQARSCELALAEIKEVLARHGVALNDIGLTEIEGAPIDGSSPPVQQPKKRPSAKGKSVPATRRPLKKVLKSDRTVAFTGGRCNQAGRKKDGETMDPSKWDDPTDDELRKWARNGTLA